MEVDLVVDLFVLVLAEIALRHDITLRGTAKHVKIHQGTVTCVWSPALHNPNGSGVAACISPSSCCLSSLNNTPQAPCLHDNKLVLLILIVLMILKTYCEDIAHIRGGKGCIHRIEVHGNKYKPG